MFKRGLVVGSVVVAILLMLCLGLWYFLFYKTTPVQIKKDSFKAVPADVILLEHFNEYASLADAFADTSSYLSIWTHSNSALDEFLTRFTAYAKESAPELLQAETLCTLHDAGNNTISVLFTMALNPVSGGKQLIHFFTTSKQIACTTRDYHRKTIYLLSFGEQQLSVSFLRDYLLASTSAEVLESAIRQLETDSSLLDDPEFASLLDDYNLQPQTRIFIRNSRISKIFSVFFSRKAQQYANFCKKTANWIVLDGKIASDAMLLDGFVKLDQKEQSYFAIFANQQARDLNAWQSLPPNTLGFLSLSFSQIDTLLLSYADYLDVYKQKDDYDARIAAIEKGKNISLKDWFSLLYPYEISLACLPYKGEIHWVTYISSLFISQAKTQFSVFGPQNFYGINPNPIPQIPGVLFGSVFDINPASHYCYIGSDIVFSDREMLEYLERESLTPNPYTLYHNLKQAKVADKIVNKANLTLFIQPAIATDSLFSFIDKRYVAGLDSLRRYNTQYVVFQLNADEEKLNAQAFVYGKKNEDAPYIRKIKPAKLFNAYSPDSLLRAQDPYKVLNHSTQKENLLHQEAWPSNKLRLIDNKNKLLWEIAFPAPISDTVMQIDYLKNNKLQMLFAASNQLHLIDRLGRPVEPFPISYNSDIVFGPYVFDIQNNKEYQIFLVHKDGILRRYTRDGEPYRDWHDYVLPSYATAPLRLLETPEGAFLVVYTAVQTAFLTMEGEVKTVLNNDDALKADAPLNYLSGGQLESVSLSGKTIKINLL